MHSTVELSIIVPCYNEGENVLELAERARVMFEHRRIRGEVVFVNDCSKDNTGELIDGLAARYDFVRVVHHQVNRGMPGGWRSGVEAARGRYVAIMDGDLQYLPEDVYRLYRELKYTNADVVQGWRSHIGRPRDFRYTMSRVLHWMLRAFFGTHLHDIKSGFLVCEREVFAHMLRHRFHYYYFQTFIVISAVHKGYRVEEIESLFEERKLGESFISAFPLKMILKNLVDLAKGFVEFRLLTRRSDVLGDFLARHAVADRPAPSAARRAYLRLFGALMPLHHWKLSPAALRYHQQLRRTQWLDAERLRELQDTRLRMLLNDAYHHVPYYRETFDRLGFSPAELGGVDDLSRLPLLTRELVRRNLHFDLISEMHDKRRMLPLASSGAHGEPLLVYTDSDDLEQRWANALRAREWSGYRFGDRIVAPWAPPGARRGLRVRLDAVLSRRTVVEAVERDEAAVRAAVEGLRGSGAALLEGDAEALGLLALLTGEGAGGRVPAVVTHGQTLTREARAAIERCFGTRVFDVYGTRELGEIAHQCEARQGYHIDAESFVVEILCGGRPARPGEVGELVVTPLTNRSVPLIRFAVGDRAAFVAEPCPCGRALPRIDRIAGRPATVVVGANGCFVPRSYFDDALADQGHAVRRFRITQTRPGAIELRLVPGARFSEKVLQALLAEFRSHLGADAVIDVVRVESLDGAADVAAEAPSAPAAH